MLAAGLVLLALVVAGCSSPTPAATPTPGNGTAASGISFVDTNGNTVNMSGPAHRVIVTNSDCAEVMIAIGAKDDIVGVSDTVKQNPTIGPLLANVTSIGSWSTPNLEEMATLQPDAVITYASWAPTNADQFSTINATFVKLDCGNMGTLARDIHSMGVMTGHEQQADAFANFTQSILSLVDNRTANLTADQKPATYWEYNTAWSTAGNGAGGDVLINDAGGSNIAHSLGNASNPYVTVSSEFVLPKNPQIVLKYSGFSVTTTNLANFSALRNSTMSREGIAGTAAARNGSVYVISSTIAYGAKAPIGLLYIAKIEHPDLFRDVDPAAMLDQYAAQFVPGTNKTIVIFPNPA